MFERKKIKYAHHIESEHNPMHYIFYKMYLESKREEDLTVREKLALKLIKGQDISVFPIGRAMSLPENTAAATGTDEEKEEGGERTASDSREVNAQVNSFN